MSAIPTPDDTMLGLLCIQPIHGYELLRRFHDRAELGSVWRLSASQLYSVLKRLADGNWIVGQHVVTPLAPERTEYSVTESGRERMMEWLTEPAPSPSVRTVRVEFVSRLIIARGLHLPLEGMIHAQRAACVCRLADLRHSIQNARSPNERLSLELVISQTEALLGWMDRAVPNFIAEWEIQT
ncbi:MAG: PadR family transcriptional regulator [Anaerolineae bacterium]